MNKKNTVAPSIILFGIFVVLGVLLIKADLKKNGLKIGAIEIEVNKLANQLGYITENINSYKQELSSLNLKVSVLNEELNYFNKSINGNGHDLSELELKIKDVIADLRKVKSMTELQNRKLYVSE